MTPNISVTAAVRRNIDGTLIASARMPESHGPRAIKE